MKKIKNGPIENIFIKISPFSSKVTKLILVLISVVNLTFSVFLFTETISKLEQTNELAQFFQLRSQNTTSK